MGKVLPYSLLTDDDIQLLKQGKHFRLFEKMGNCHAVVEGMDGVYFAVWAPNARRVCVIGDFNFWDYNAHPLLKRLDETGIWEGFIPGVGKGTLYKYLVLSADGRPMEKADPFAYFSETPPKSASIVWDLNYQWHDDDWLKKQAKNADKPAPMSVYEVHLASWKKQKNLDSLSYKELADELVPYVKKMGFTHVEMLPVMEHPYYPSWGYQVTGFFAASGRLGIPQDLMRLIDVFHQNDIGVLLDWVPSHFPGDGHGLAYFDGTHLYEHPDPRRGFHPDWKSYIFNYGRYEVRSFLISNAIFWLEKYHADGLRVDAVASMLYLDYSRNAGEWTPNELGGRDNLDAIAFLKDFNAEVRRSFPAAVTVAEESTAYPKVTALVEEGGLGFHQKWMMGWMHDTLKYFKEDPINRKYHHGAITFSIVYAFDEKFMLPLSHDEVVHGKSPMIYKMPGDEWQKFANLRLLYGYMFTHPGTKLLYMGGEFGQTTEWSEELGVQWQLLKYPVHKHLQTLVKDLNHFYQKKEALFEKQFDSEGFEWVDTLDAERSVLIYLRKGEKDSKLLLVACNFTPVVREDYLVGVPEAGVWAEVFNTDDEKYGGSGVKNEPVKSKKKEMHHQKNSILLTLPPLAMIVLERRS